MLYLQILSGDGDISFHRTDYLSRSIMGIFISLFLFHLFMYLFILKNR